MADHAMIFPAMGIAGLARKTERRTEKSIFMIFCRWYNGSFNMSQRMYGANFSQIADPKTGTYERLY